jgi:hypothetical protein
VIILKERCSFCGCVLTVFDAHQVPTPGEVRLLCGSCFKLGGRYVALRARGLSDRQAWRKLKRGKGGENGAPVS